MEIDLTKPVMQSKLSQAYTKAHKTFDEIHYSGFYEKTTLFTENQ
jgi:hypothetical protein